MMTTCDGFKASTGDITNLAPMDRLSSITKPKETGREFWERLGKPKWVLAPMVDQSEFVCYFLRVSCLSVLLKRFLGMANVDEVILASGADDRPSCLHAYDTLSNVHRDAQIP